MPVISVSYAVENVSRRLITDSSDHPQTILSQNNERSQQHRPPDRHTMHRFRSCGYVVPFSCKGSRLTANRDVTGYPH